MKKLTYLLFVLLGFAFSSCSTYYYSTVSAYEQRVPQNNDGTFTTEKNNIFVTYAFVNHLGEVVYDIFNQSENPIYVDWSKSVLIVEDHAIQYGEKYIAGDFLSDDDDFSFSQKPVAFIPPFSRVKYSPVLLGDLYNMKLPNSAYQKIDLGDNIVVDGVHFTAETSPLLFRSYLTVVNNTTKEETVFEDIFYISTAYKTSGRVDALDRRLTQKGNTFYYYELSSSSRFIGWAILGTISVGALFIPNGGY